MHFDFDKSPIIMSLPWQVHVFHIVSLLFIAMLASVSFPPCFLTFYSSNQSLLSFLNHNLKLFLYVHSSLWFSYSHGTAQM